MKSVYKRVMDGISFDVTHPSTTLAKIYLGTLYNSFSRKLTGKVDYSSEVFFWQKEYYRWSIVEKKPVWWTSSGERNRCSDELKPVMEALKRDFGSDLKLIDVGSGPVTSFFNELDVTRYDITTVDPLAKWYNQLNKKYRVKYKINCVEGMGESVDKLFDPESFHLVLSQNSIDHASSPDIFVKNLYSILKPGGFLYLMGFFNEGEAANWLGLHQHNLYVKGADLYWTNRDGSVFDRNLTGGLKMSLFYKYCEGSKTGDKFILIYKKDAAGEAK
jgi:SAM-dependent methyltransferase